MKSFKQYILEMPIIIRGHSRYDDKSYPGPKHIGRVGSYSVTHVPDADMDDTTGIFHIIHNNKRVGYIPYESDGVDTLHFQGPSLMNSHRGKKAKTNNLMPKVYGLIADKMKKKVQSDNYQTRGGASIWRRLAYMRKVTVRHFNRDEPSQTRIKGRYIPDQHEKIVYDRTHGADYALVLHPRRGKKK